MLRVEPLVLEGQIVRLVPAERRHAETMYRHADPSIFTWFLPGAPSAQSATAMADYIEMAVARPDSLTFAVVLKESEEAIGMTSYMEIKHQHLALEIGMTWYGIPYQGTKVNPECKLLLLGHAFEVLGCARVQLKTDARNLRSQRNIEKLGAQKEGVLRNFGMMPDGFIRDTVMYSILPDEWPEVKAKLLRRLDR